MIVHPGNGAINGYNLERSLRFRASATAFLSRTTGTATNQNKWTWSGWVKRGTLGTAQVLINGYEDDSNLGNVAFVDDCLQVARLIGGAVLILRKTNAVFRDPSAWYHVVVVFDNANATIADRVQIYVNNVLQTYSTSNDPSTSGMFINANSKAQRIGRSGSTASPFYLDGYLTEVNFIDGQALTPSSFGSTNALAGVWQPAAYTGTYGTNGFYLPFTDNSALTTSSNVGLGKDFSGNGNYWTTNNISLTSGVTYDSMTDVPTLTSDTAANYAVLNPISKSTAVTLSNANLTFTGSDSAAGTMFVSSGTAYFEALFTGSPPSTGVGIGLISGNKTLPLASGYPSAVANLWYVYNGGGATATFNSEGTATDTTSGAIPVSGNTLQIAIDASAGKAWYGQNNTWYDSSGGTTGNPATGANPTFTISSPSTRNGFTLFLYTFASGATFQANFGQRPFAYTPPTGFVALNTFNIDEGTITTSGTFTGNASADGPSINLNGVPTAMTINGNAVTWGTHADKTSYGFKVRSSSTSYNSTGTNTYSVSTVGAVLKYANAQGNP